MTEYYLVEKEGKELPYYCISRNEPKGEVKLKIKIDRKDKTKA